jgi:hypothetical protein
MVRISFAVIAFMAAAAPAAAQNSHCAALPVNVQVEARGPDNVINAQLTPRGITCPRGFTSESIGPLTRCRQPGSVRLENREPRKACYAALNLGPVRAPQAQNRPTANCPAHPTLTSIVALRGRNVGWQDVTLTAPQGSGLTVEHLRAIGGRTPAAEDPQRQDCFAFECRLVRLTFRPTTPARVDLTLATPGGGASPVNIAVNSEASCPPR